MGKGRKGGTRSAPQTIEMESNEEMYDDVEKFHREDRKIASGKIWQKKTRVVEEVLNVEGDRSSDEEDDEADENDNDSDFGSDAEKEKDEALLPSREEWGKQRKGYFNTGFVDEDYGDVGNSDMEELAQLEETDAVVRQKELDASAALAADEDDQWEEEPKDEKKKTAKKKLTSVEKKWDFSLVQEANEKLEEMLDTLKEKSDLHDFVIKPLPAIIAALPATSHLRKQLLLVTDVYSSYLLNLTLWCKLKAESIGQKKVRDAAVDEHPVLEDIERLRPMVSKCEDFLSKNSDAINHLTGLVDEGKSLSGLIRDDEVAEKKKTRKAMDMDEETVEAVLGEEEDEEEDGKRGVSYAIGKNKGLKQKKKKGPAHSRAAKKKQYHKALVKRRSQVPDIRREDRRYEGEARGIRAFTVKSTKLVA